MSMNLSFLSISKLAISLTSLAKDSPLTNLAKNEYYMAVYILNSAKDEQHIREVINRALCHLESAFVNFPITTWDILDRDTALWEKKTFANSICLHIAILHYMLGNNLIAKKWLLENLNVMGSITFPNEILSSLSMADVSDFYKAVAGVDCKKIEELVQQSILNYDRAFDRDSNDLVRYGSPIYSG